MSLAETAIWVATLSGWRWRRDVRVVVTDSSKSYRFAIDAHLGHVRHVLDRFHVSA